MKLSARSDLRRGMATIGVLVSLGLVMTAGGTAWAATGDADPGFGGALHGNVRFGLGLPGVVLSGLAVQSGGGIVSVGTVPVGATEDAMAYRLHADGTTDSRSGRVRLPAPRDADESASAVVAQRDGKVVVVGYVTDSGGFPDFAVWRLTSTGAIDKTFGTNGLVTFGRPDTAEVALDVALDRQGRIVVAGYTIGSDADIAVVRVTPTGTLDRTFNDGVPMFAPPHRGTDLARGVAVQPNGNIIVGGLYAGAVGNAVVRIIPGTPGTATPQAALDPSFGGGGGFADVPGTLASSYPDVAVTTDGKILLLDRVPGTGGSVDGTVVRLTSRGAVDDSFGSATGAHLDVIDGDSEALDALTILPRGGVAVVGHTLAAGGSFITKLDPKGSPDPGMGPGGVKALAGLDVNAPVRLAALSDGRILTMGTSHTSTGVAYRFLGDFVAPSCAGKRATITGTQASDTLVGTPRVDVIAGLGGADRITGLGKGDIVCGGPGADHIFGGAGNDQLYGQAGPDTISGGKGRDKLIGGQGHDTLNGGPGHDTIRQ